MKCGKEIQSSPETRFKGTELRRHKRYSFSWPLKICPLESCSAKMEKPPYAGKIKNVGKNGMKISLLASLEKNEHILLFLDLAKIDAFIDRRKLLTISDNRLLAQVTWRKLNLNTGLFETGLKFIEESERKNFESMLHLAEG